MKNEELVGKMKEKTRFSYKELNSFITSFIESVEEALENGDRVQIVGFGTFETRTRASRIGKNPRTKEQINIPESTVPVFKSGTELKEKVKRLSV